MRRVLLVTRNFAPTSHVSAERATKLAKYLPEFGWQPTVLTGTRPSFGLQTDPGQAAQVAGVQVIRTPAPEFSVFYARGARPRTRAAKPGRRRRGGLHPKAWLIPDSQILWYPFAVRAALRHHHGTPWDVVLATSFPPTAILIAHTVASRLGLPYLIDFRDSWTAYHSAPRRPAPLADLERRLERRMITGAAAVVTVDPMIVEHAFGRIAPGDRPPLHTIQNGYDEEDFRHAAPADLPRFSIVHTGLLRRSPEPLWKALAQALCERPALGGRVHLWQVGFVAPEARAGLAAPPPGVTVHEVPPVPQREAISYMLGADLLLVEEFGKIMPSKTLQYLRAGRPVLAFQEDGGVIRDVLQSVPGAVLVGRVEASRAASLIAELASRPRCPPHEPVSAVAGYERREIARRFAAVLDGACRGIGTGPGTRVGSRPS